MKAEDVINNDYVAGANDFDHDKVKADADGFQLSDEFSAVPAAEPGGEGSATSGAEVANGIASVSQPGDACPHAGVIARLISGVRRIGCRHTDVGVPQGSIAHGSTTSGFAR